MLTFFLISLAWTTLTLIPPSTTSPTTPQANRTCHRTALKKATDRYLISQATGQLGWLQAILSPTATYHENLIQLNPSNSTLSQSLRIDHTRTAYDLTQCTTYTELLATDPQNPYQIGMQLHLDPTTGKITKLDGIVTTLGDFTFNASHTLHYTLRENWSTIPTKNRDSRATLQAAADAYYDFFVNKSVVVPWGKPCSRLEGGYLSANGDCNTDIPDVTIRTLDRRYVIDETLGVVDVISNFGILGPDSHEFRIVNGSIRHIHTMTLCRPVMNCGLEVPALLGEDVGF